MRRFHVIFMSRHAVTAITAKDGGCEVGGRGRGKGNIVAVLASFRSTIQPGGREVVVRKRSMLEGRVDGVVMRARRGRRDVGSSSFPARHRHSPMRFVAPVVFQREVSVPRIACNQRAGNQSCATVQSTALAVEGIEHHKHILLVVVRIARMLDLDGVVATARERVRG